MSYPFPKTHIDLCNAGWGALELGAGSLRRFRYDGCNHFDGDPQGVEAHQHVFILADTYNMQFKWIDAATNKPFPGLDQIVCASWELADFLAACPPPINKPRSCGARVKRWILK